MGQDPHSIPGSDQEAAEPADGGEVDSISAIIAMYKKDVDRTLLRSRLRLTPEERLLDHSRALRQVEEVRRAGRAAGLHGSARSRHVP